MKFSVIVPTWDDIELLPYLLYSIDNQTYRKFEVIVVGDGYDKRVEELIIDFQSKINELIIEAAEFVKIFASIAIKSV